jgi:hypothetical protein
MQAIAVLLGPILLGKLSTFAEFDYRGCASAAVDGFLATHARDAGRVRAAPHREKVAISRLQPGEGRRG